MDMARQEFAVAEAKARFSDLLSRAEAGEEITIKRHGVAVAKLVPVYASRTIEDRQRRLSEFQDWRRKHGPILGPDITIRQLIDEGRR